MLNIIIEKGRELFHKIRDVKVRDVFSAFSFAIALPISCIFRYFHNDLWLVCENENEARDNGYWFFKYVCENHPEQEIIYAIDFRSPDFEKVKRLGKVVQTSSLKHWIYYLAASKNLSSQKGDGKPNAALCYVLEIYFGLNTHRIFLQHGVIINDCKWLYYPICKFDMFVCSAKPEYDFVKNNFGYPDGIVKYLGMPRQDMLHDITVNKKQILVMPSWRNWLVMKRNNENGRLPDFTETEYYKNWFAFINNQQLVEFIEENNLQLIFYPHRNVQRFINLFYSSSQNIKIASSEEYDIQNLLKESVLLITDYSSVFMDFAYMKKPIIFYQFDIEKFRAAQYQQGYFDYQDNAFGNSYSDMYEIVEALKSFFIVDFKVNSRYEQNHKSYFKLFDSDNNLRLYNYLKANNN